MPRLTSFSLIERVILSAGAMLIFSVSFQIDQMPEGETTTLIKIYIAILKESAPQPTYPSSVLTRPHPSIVVAKLSIAASSVDFYYYDFRRACGHWNLLVVQLLSTAHRAVARSKVSLRIVVGDLSP